MLSSTDYSQSVVTLNPDIAVALGDVPFGVKLGHRRLEKMASRTERWVAELAETLRNESASHSVAVFAPILPIEIAQQSLYLDRLADDLLSDLSGLALYHADVLLDLPSRLSHLPRLTLTNASGPHQLLDEISTGADLCAVPFIGAVTDAGIALGFTFPPPVASDKRIPLGMDMWDSKYSLDSSPLTDDCSCYACRTHHRAYIQHLLSAKEMLAWVLLQVHNHQVIDQFFAGVRQSIAADTFESDRALFSSRYESELPAKTGSGPRVRGYQFKSEGPGEAKRNPPAYRQLGEAEESNSEAAELDADAVASEVARSSLTEPIEAVEQHQK